MNRISIVILYLSGAFGLVNWRHYSTLRLTAFRQ